MRKGPEHVPASWLVLVLAVVLMQGTSFIGAALIDYGDAYSHLLVFVSTLLAMAIYTFVLYLSGHPGRFLQTLSAILGCGAILILLFVASYVLLKPLLGAELSIVLATLFIFWSVPVEGHIIARAIGRGWYLGIAIAMTVFIAQYAFQTQMTGRL